MRIEPSHGRAPSRAVIAISITFLMMIWAINFLVVKIGIRYLPVVTFASFRIIAAALFMVAIAPICHRLPVFRKPSSDGSLDPSATSPASTSHESRLAKHVLRDYWTFAYLGLFGVSINQFCFTLGLRYTNVTHSSIVVGMAPIYTLALAVLFRLETVTWHKALGMLIALAGVIALASGAGMGHVSPTLLGDAITMCGSLGFASYVVLGKRVAARYDSLTMTTWNFIFGGLVILPVAFQQAIKFDLFRHAGEIPWQAWACIAFTGLFSSTLAYLLYFWLLRYLEASQLASFSYLLPVFASALSILFLGERGSWLELLGGCLALLGVYTIESARGK